MAGRAHTGAEVMGRGRGAGKGQCVYYGGTAEAGLLPVVKSESQTLHCFRVCSAHFPSPPSLSLSSPLALAQSCHCAGGLGDGSVVIW